MNKIVVSKEEKECSLADDSLFHRICEMKKHSPSSLIELELLKIEAEYGTPEYSDHILLSILAEEFGEIACNLNESMQGKYSRLALRENLEVELTQVAAVAILWIQTLRRRDKELLSEYNNRHQNHESDTVDELKENEETNPLAMVPPIDKKSKEYRNWRRRMWRKNNPEKVKAQKKRYKEKKKSKELLEVPKIFEPEVIPEVSETHTEEQDVLVLTMPDHSFSESSTDTVTGQKPKRRKLRWKKPFKNSKTSKSSQKTIRKKKQRITKPSLIKKKVVSVRKKKSEEQKTIRPSTPKIKQKVKVEKVVSVRKKKTEEQKTIPPSVPKNKKYGNTGMSSIYEQILKENGITPTYK